MGVSHGISGRTCGLTAEIDDTVKAVLTSIHAHVHQRRALVILALIMLALVGALLVTVASDGHLHAGGKAIISMSASGIDSIINSLLFLVGVMAMPQMLRLIPKRAVAPADDPPSRPPAPQRVTMPASPCLLALCRIQI